MEIVKLIEKVGDKNSKNGKAPSDKKVVVIKCGTI